MRGWCSWPHGSGLVHNPNPARPEWTHRASLLDPVSFSQRLLEKPHCSSQPSPRPGSYQGRRLSPPHAQGSFRKRCPRGLRPASALCNPPGRTAPAALAPAQAATSAASPPPPAPAPQAPAALRTRGCTGCLAGPRPLPRPGHPAWGPTTQLAPRSLPPAREAPQLSPLLPGGHAAPSLGSTQGDPRALAQSGFWSRRNATVLPSQNSESGCGLPP